MSSDPWAELLEEYWTALTSASTQEQAEQLRAEILKRLEHVASSLDLLTELHDASQILDSRPGDSDKSRE